MIKNTFRRISNAIVILIVAASTPSISHSQTVTRSGDAHMQNDYSHIGHELRKEIDAEYKKIKERKISTHNNKADISALIEKYIPIGSSFDAAEEILKNAGFTVSPRPGPNPVGNRPDRYSVVAAISPLESSFPKKTDVYVFLTPKNHGDYTSGIAEISAKITISFV